MQNSFKIFLGIDYSSVIQIGRDFVFNLKVSYKSRIVNPLFTCITFLYTDQLFDLGLIFLYQNNELLNLCTGKYLFLNESKDFNIKPAIAYCMLLTLTI